MPNVENHSNTFVIDDHAAVTQITWKQVAEVRFWRFLEILPPRFQAQYGFLVGEPQTHRICTVGGDFRAAYTAFYEIAGRFFEAASPLTCAEFQTINPKDVVDFAVDGAA